MSGRRHSSMIMNDLLFLTKSRTMTTYVNKYGMILKNEEEKIVKNVRRFSMRFDFIIADFFLRIRNVSDFRPFISISSLPFTFFKLPELFSIFSIKKTFYVRTYERK